MRGLPPQHVFGMPNGPSLPYRSSRKEAPRVQGPRGFVRRRPQGRSTEDAYAHVISPWQQNNMPSYPPAPYAGRFEECGDRGRPQHMPAGYGTTYTPRYLSPQTRYPAEEPVPFEQAAKTLYRALHQAIKHCQVIREQFEVEVAAISHWTPPPVIDALWNLRLDWAGDSYVALKGQQHRPPWRGHAVSYRSTVEQVARAMQGMTRCARPRLELWEDEGGSRPSRGYVGCILEGLEATLRGTEDLVMAVRKDRGLMEPLVEKLEAAAEMLRDAEGPWTPPRRGRRLGKQKAGFESDEESNEEYKTKSEV